MFTRPPTAFLPPQLRHRPPGPPPRPPFPPARPPMGMQGPPMMGGPGGMPPPSFPGQPPMYGMPEGGMNPGMPPMAVEQQPPQTISAPPVIVERPKVVYSAPPVRNVPKSSSQPSITQQQPNGVEAGPTVSGEAALELLGEDTTPVDMEMDTEATPGAEAAAGKREKKEKKKKYIRTAASQTWEDPTLAEWDPDDFRLFCGDLGNEVTDEVLTRAFSKYPSFVKAKVVRDRRTNKTKGYGFASFKDPADFTRAMREMNGKYVGNRPIKLRKSTWKERNLEVVRRKEKEKKRLGLR